MPLDEATFSKDLTNCIADAPDKARHKGRVFNIHTSTADDIFRTIEAGIRDDMTVSVICNVDDFKDILPKPLDDFDILINKKWVRFQIASAPDFYHAGISPVYQINLQSPHKGVE